MSDIYKDPIVQTIIDLLEANGPTELRGRYINGDVLLPNKTELPICYVAKDTTQAQPADNMEDEHLIAMFATVILDLTQDLNESYEMVAGTPKLYDMCEGRNDDFSLREDTVLYQLRNSQQLAPKLWIGVGTPVIVGYGVGIQRRGPGTFSVEAVIRFNVRLHTPRPGI